MSAYYGLYGGISLRKCPEVRDLIKRLRECTIVDVEVSEPEPGAIGLFLDGVGIESSACLLETEDVLQKLGRYSLEPAVIFCNLNHEEDVLVVAATEQLRAETLSRHRLQAIRELMKELVPKDRARLAKLAAAPPSARGRSK